jgi:hypothetical protein
MCFRFALGEEEIWKKAKTLSLGAQDQFSSRNLIEAQFAREVTNFSPTYKVLPFDNYDRTLKEKHFPTGEKLTASANVAAPLLSNFCKV